MSEPVQCIVQHLDTTGDALTMRISTGYPKSPDVDLKEAALVHLKQTDPNETLPRNTMIHVQYGTKSQTFRVFELREET